MTQDYHGEFMRPLPPNKQSDHQIHEILPPPNAPTRNLKAKEEVIMAPRCGNNGWHEIKGSLPMKHHPTPSSLVVSNKISGGVQCIPSVGLHGLAMTLSIH